MPQTFKWSQVVWIGYSGKQLKCFNCKNLMLFTLDQEYEVKSLCETLGTKQKKNYPDSKQC